ncbi:hypothetical protein KSF78_0007755 [Schistosoma japonicum]|nr:hypothetical protein KSF78_0007755 [Schistosoma japonicum]
MLIFQHVERAYERLKEVLTHSAFNSSAHYNDSGIYHFHPVENHTKYNGNKPREYVTVEDSCDQNNNSNIEKYH